MQRSKSYTVCIVRACLPVAWAVSVSFADSRQHAGVVHGDTLFLVGNLQSPDPEERPVLPTVIVMCQYHFSTQKWTRLKLRAAPEVCHYPLLAAYDDQLILFGGKA